MTVEVNRKLRPMECELIGAGHLSGYQNELCLSAVAQDGRRVFIALTETQAEQLSTMLGRAVDQGFWGDNLPESILIPHMVKLRHGNNNNIKPVVGSGSPKTKLEAIASRTAKK